MAVSASSGRTCRPGFVRVIDRALAPAPRDRYASADALLKALSAVFSDAWTPRVIAKRLLTLVLFAAVAGSIVLALGALNSAVFNTTLGRWDFASESLRELFVWGLRSIVVPATLAMLSLLAVGLFVVLRRLALGLSPAVVRVDEALRGRLDERARRLHLDDVSMLASWVLVISGSALAFSWWYFSALVDAVMTRISTERVERLLLLTPSDDHYHYLFALSWLVVITVAAWSLTMAVAARKGQRLHLGVRAGGAAIVALALISLSAPYRLFLHSTFEAVLWNGATCYVIGERPDDLLLFCSELPPPRNNIVRKDAESLHRTGRSPESIFTGLSGAGGGAQKQQSAVR